MLYFLTGTVALIEPGLAVLDCGGVGYACKTTNYTCLLYTSPDDGGTGQNGDDKEQKAALEGHIGLILSLIHI